MLINTRSPLKKKALLKKTFNNIANTGLGALFISMESNVVYQIIIGPYKQIGSTNNVKRRMSEHLRQLKSGKHANLLMQGAYNKYALFDFTILKTFSTREEAYQYEQILLNELCRTKGYLMMSNHATGFMSGKSHPNKAVEFRSNQSQRMIQNNPMKDPQIVEKQKTSLREHRKVNPQNLDYLRTEEVLKKKSESMKRYLEENPKNQKGANNPNARRILNVETGEIYDTGREACKALGYKAAWISTLAKKGKKLKFI